MDAGKGLAVISCFADEGGESESWAHFFPQFRIFDSICVYSLLHAHFPNQWPFFHRCLFAQDPLSASEICSSLAASW